MTDLHELEQRIARRRGAPGFEVGAALLEAYRKGTFREAGFAKFEDWTRSLGIARSTAFALAEAADFLERLRESEPPVELPRLVAHYRPLTRIKATRTRFRAWREAVATAPPGGITRRHVEAVVAARLRGETYDPATTPPPPEERPYSLQQKLRTAIPTVQLNPEKLRRLAGNLRQIADLACARADADEAREKQEGSAS